MSGFAEQFLEQEWEVKNGAVLIIDMLNDFCAEDGLMPLDTSAEIIEPLQRLIAAARERDMPIIYINDRHRAERYDAEFEKRDPHTIDGTWGAEVIDELAPEEKDWVVYKRRYSGFFQTDLDLILREHGIETLICTGVVTNICVMSTVADGFFRGYNIIVPEDGTRATADREQDSTLWDIKTHFGTVTVVDEIIKKMD